MGSRGRTSSSSQDDVARGGMSGYLLAFEIISVHLVVVLVGAAYLARAQTPRSRAAAYVAASCAAVLHDDVEPVG